MIELAKMPHLRFGRYSLGYFENNTSMTPEIFHKFLNKVYYNDEMFTLSLRLEKTTHEAYRSCSDYPNQNDWVNDNDCNMEYK